MIVSLLITLDWLDLHIFLILSNAAAVMCPAKPLDELSVGWGCTNILFAEVQDACKPVRKNTLKDAISFKSTKFFR